MLLNYLTQQMATLTNQCFYFNAKKWQCYYCVVNVVSGMQLEDCVALYVDVLDRGRFWDKSVVTAQREYDEFKK